MTTARDSLHKSYRDRAGRIAKDGSRTALATPAEKSPPVYPSESPERSRGETQDERAEEGQSR